MKKKVQYISVLTLYSIPRVQIVSNISAAVQTGAGGFSFSAGIRKGLSMDKHTKTIIIFYVSMLLASLVTFSVLYLLPLVTSGTDPTV